MIDPDDRQPGEPPFPGIDVGARLESLPHAYISNLDPMVLAAIGKVLLGGAFETWIDAVVEPPVLLDPERQQEDRLCKLPLPLVESLASLSDERISEAGEALAETIADVVGVPSEPSECTAMLANLQALARTPDHPWASTSMCSAKCSNKRSSRRRPAAEPIA